MPASKFNNQNSQIYNDRSFNPNPMPLGTASTQHRNRQTGFNLPNKDRSLTAQLLPDTPNSRHDSNPIKPSPISANPIARMHDAIPRTQAPLQFQRWANFKFRQTFPEAKHLRGNYIFCCQQIYPENPPSYFLQNGSDRFPIGLAGLAQRLDR